MRVIFTCGGTGGHINPALAVAKLLRAKRPESEILFVGAVDGMEANLIPREGFRLETLTVASYLRKLTPSAIRHNVRTAVAIRRALRRADEIIDEFRPDVILGTGGYASFPMLKQGTKRHIPTAVHESNAVPGLATRLVADRVDKILVSFEECRNAYRNRDRVEVVGMPVQEEFLYTRREDARRTLGIGDEPLVVSAWGSLGAREMNRKIVDFMRLESKEKLWQHIHATGSFGWKWMPEYVKEQGIDLAANPQIVMQEYIYNMPTLMAAADLVISRAGASTLNEIAVAGTPCIIVPSPNVTNNHQEKNARVLEAAGGAVVVLEKDCTPQKLYELIRSLLADEDRRREMSRKLHTMVRLDSAERICDIVEQLTQSEK